MHMRRNTHPDRKPSSVPSATATAATEDTPTFLSVGEVAALLRTTRKAVWSRHQRRQIPGAINVGRTLLFDKVVLLGWLQSCAATRRLDEVRNGDVAAIKSRLKEQTKKATNNVLAVLSTMLKVAVELEVIDVVPVTVKYLPIAKRTEKPFYEMAVYEKLVDAAAAIDVRIEVLLLLLGDVGLRRGEAIALDWTKVALGRRQLDVVVRQWKDDLDVPKGGIPRLGLTMTTRLCEALARLPLRAGRVLVDDKGKRLTAYRVREWIAAAEAKAGLPVTMRSHILRHSFCSHLAALGGPIAGDPTRGGPLRVGHHRGLHAPVARQALKGQ